MTQEYKHVAVPLKWQDHEGNYVGPPEHADKFGNVPLTPEELSEKLTREQAHNAVVALKVWLSEMRELDTRLTRREEDLIDWISNATGASVNSLAEPIKTAYLAKKEKRAQRPK